ncbi:hypothetical protein B0H14DRAFT_2578680 [Mycena olivaceomarginata]|nr:hypothetical protein B0H14DRAFT_2578680 [Mycena olivaceomarginata]
MGAAREPEDAAATKSRHIPLQQMDISSMVKYCPGQFLHDQYPCVSIRVWERTHSHRSTPPHTPLSQWRAGIHSLELFPRSQGFGFLASDFKPSQAHHYGVYRYNIGGGVSPTRAGAGDILARLRKNLANRIGFTLRPMLRSRESVEPSHPRRRKRKLPTPHMSRELLLGPLVDARVMDARTDSKLGEEIHLVTGGDFSKVNASANALEAGEIDGDDSSRIRRSGENKVRGSNVIDPHLFAPRKYSLY